MKCARTPWLTIAATGLALVFQAAAVDAQSRSSSGSRSTPGQSGATQPLPSPSPPPATPAPSPGPALGTPAPQVPSVAPLSPPVPPVVSSGGGVPKQGSGSLALTPGSQRNGSQLAWRRRQDAERLHGVLGASHAHVEGGVAGRVPTHAQPHSVTRPLGSTAGGPERHWTLLRARAPSLHSRCQPACPRDAGRPPHSLAPCARP